MVAVLGRLVTRAGVAMVYAVVVSLVLIAWNTATNLAGSPRRWYVPSGLVLAVALVVTARLVGLTTEEIGVAWPQDLRWLGAMVAGVAIVVSTAAALAERWSWLRALFEDRRARLEDAALRREVLWRIPVGTALVEEVAFRGVLLAAFADVLLRGQAVAASAIVFGLWHVGPTVEALRINEVPLGTRRGTGLVVGAVAATTVAGVGLALLRDVSGGLLAPVVAHWAANGFGLVSAAVVQRTSNGR